MRDVPTHTSPPCLHTAHKQTRQTTHPDTAAACGGIGKTERDMTFRTCGGPPIFLPHRTFERRPISCCADLRTPTDFLLDVGRHRIDRLTLHPPIFPPIFFADFFRTTKRVFYGKNEQIKNRSEKSVSEIGRPRSAHVRLQKMTPGPAALARPAHRCCDATHTAPPARRSL